MKGFYRVTKRINGRLYDYWQRSKRVGKSVKTENVYIGPSQSSVSAMGPSSSTTAPITPEAAIDNFRRLSDDLTYLKRFEEKQRREDERIQYGPLAARIRKQRAAVQAAKRATKGIKSVNPFAAKILKTD